MDYTFDQTTINGVAYANALLMRNSSGTGLLQINAGRSQTTFEGALGIPDSQHSSTSYQVQISLDNSAPVYSVQINFGQTKQLKIDVTNALRVKISITPLAGSDEYVGIGDPRFG